MDTLRPRGETPELSLKKGTIDVTEKAGPGVEGLLKDFFLAGVDDREDYGTDLRYTGSFAKIADALRGGASVRDVKVKYRLNVPQEATVRLSTGDVLTLTGPALDHVNELV